MPTSYRLKTKTRTFSRQPKPQHKYDFGPKHQAKGLTLVGLVMEAIRNGSSKGLTPKQIKTYVWKAHKISIRISQIYSSIQNLRRTDKLEAYDPRKSLKKTSSKSVTKRPVGRPKGSKNNVVPFYKRAA